VWRGEGEVYVWLYVYEWWCMCMCGGVTWVELSAAAATLVVVGG